MVTVKNSKMSTFQKIYDLIEKIQNNLNPEYLKEEYRNKKPKNAHPYFGHCYVASETFYHMLGKELGFKPYSIRIKDIVHWYLMKDFMVIDITKEQFDFDIAYTNGTCRGFLTKQPSKRTQKFINSLT